MGAKISPEKFQNLFSSAFGKICGSVLAGPQFGVDVSLVEVAPGVAMASASDPLTFIPGLGPEKSAWLSVHLNANDLATTSVPPQYYQLVLNLPNSLSEDNFKEYWLYLHQFCRDINVAITGGHTAFLPGIDSTIAGGGTMFSVGEKQKFLLSSMAQEGDLLLMSKQAAITSTAILGLSYPELMEKILGEPHQAYFEKLFYRNNLQTEAAIAAKLNQNKEIITAMHDITEGGVLGAAYEMSHAAGLGVQLNLSEVKVDDIQYKICNYFKISPFEIIGAGSMLMAVSPVHLTEVLNLYHEHELEVRIIGNFTQKGGDGFYFENGKSHPLQYIKEDPYWNAFYKAMSHE